MGLEIFFIIIIFLNYNSTKSFEMACLNNFETLISLFLPGDNLLNSFPLQAHSFHWSKQISTSCLKNQSI